MHAGMRTAASLPFRTTSHGKRYLRWLNSPLRSQVALLLCAPTRVTRVALHLRGIGEGAGTAGCPGAASERQRGSFPGPDSEGRFSGAGERRPLQPGVPAVQQRRAAAARSARQSLGKVPSAPRQQRSPAGDGGKQRRPS